MEKFPERDPDRVETVNGIDDLFPRKCQSPENPDVLTNMAMSAMTRGDTAGAEPLLRRAAAQPGASLKVRLNLAMAVGLNGKMDEAEAMMRRDLPPEAADRNLEWLRARSGSVGADQARTWSSLQGG